MNLSEIESIIDKFEQSSLTELEYETPQNKIKLKRGTSSATESSCQNVQSKTVALSTVEHKVDNTSQTIIDENIALIKAPVVGTFYVAEQEGNEPLVHVGDKVKKGDTVGMIEAMKMMSPIVSTCDGEISEIVVQNGDFVAFDQVLVKVKTNV